MSLAPQLQKITVDPNKLLLDPNNPRLFSKQEERVPLENYPDPGVQDHTKKRIETANDDFKIDDLVKSIESAGYIPEAGGYMFVRALRGTDYYVVLEGNRRLTAIRQLERPLGKIDVQEITDDIPEEELQKKISYILGTAHHGSHKSWSPFAQANEIYTTYLGIAGQVWNTFKYDQEHAVKTASMLNTNVKEVKERLAVYRAMKQLSETEEMKAIKPNGGIIDAYYSLIKDAVCATKPKLKEYIPTHPDTFLLEPEAIQRLLNLCKFNGKKTREGSPLNDNTQWRSLNKILEDDDKPKRVHNLALVEEHYQKPNEVWAQRAAELNELNWAMWMRKVRGVLEGVQISDSFDDDGAKEAIDSIDNILNSLGNTEEANNA